MLNGMTKEKLKSMYDICKFLGEKGYDQDVTIQLDRHCLSMTVWRWREVHLQVTAFDNYQADENDKLVRKGENVLGLRWKVLTFANGGTGFCCDISEDLFLKAVSDA